MLTARLAGFDWNRGDDQKSWARHGVTQAEAEDVYFNRPVLIADDANHSERERRHALLGRTNAERLLTVVFMLHRDHVRVISARPMSRKQRTQYAKVPHESP
ncbi:BrnT family toxin [Gemmatimonas sp.]|uniref:BrnT family toxin n=1 Tax=Gemmatimonas sp. TaxID=1962908 RepID=UPI0035666003